MGTNLSGNGTGAEGNNRSLLEAKFNNVMTLCAMVPLLAFTCLNSVLHQRFVHHPNHIFPNALKHYSKCYILKMHYSYLLTFPVEKQYTKYKCSHVHKQGRDGSCYVWRKPNTASTVRTSYQQSSMVVGV
jgi:hypothetical protein